jgi:hypothetical protein
LPGPAAIALQRYNCGDSFAGGGRQYSFEYAQLGGFDYFEVLRAWFPAYLNSGQSISPNHIIVDMAYAAHGRATFFNVVVPSRGNYTVTIRYAFAFGGYPGVTDRREGSR